MNAFFLLISEGGQKMKREGQIRIPSGCAIAGVIDKSGKVFNGEIIIRSIAAMHERSNGLGGGFAAYGIYPQYQDAYALHIFYDHETAKFNCEEYLKRFFDIVHQGEIPTRSIKEITDAPLIWRYFVHPLPSKLSMSELDETEYVARCVFEVNTRIDGAYIFSSGKNMGIFKGVGYPEDIGRFYRLEEYEGYCFTAHGRYPTNTPGWWGGAHPFGLLNYSVVHNGEISSYDTNRRTLEMYGYPCTLQTDTEVITYIIDYLHRKLGLEFPEIAAVIAPPFWQTIERMPSAEQEYHTYLRNVFSSLLVNGPFSILIGFAGGIAALNDRLKLRSLTVGEKGSRVYFASEEAAIRIVEPDLSRVWAPKGGEPVVVLWGDA